MKIATLIRCYHATEYLERVLRNYSIAEKILIMNYRFNSVAPISDDTEEIASRFRNTEVIKGEGVIQHEIFNMGLERLRDYDFVFISDADEFILPNEQEIIIKQMRRQGMDGGFCMVKDYYYDPYHCMEQRQGHFVAIVRPQAVKFVHIRQAQISSNKTINFPYMIHHFGFALRPERLQWKIKWESEEEKVNVGENLAKMKINNCMPPPELLNILKEG